MTSAITSPANGDSARTSAARRWPGRARSAATVAAVLVSVWVMLPPSLGGRTTFTVVSGRSMQPTYHTNDLAITHRTGSAKVGDVIVYRVPQGEPGAGGQVIHRVVGGNGVRGYVTRGDNREGPDIWRPRHADVVGKVVWLVPQGGRALAIVFNVGNLGLVALGFVAWAVWPRNGEPGADLPGADAADAETEQVGR